MSPRRAALGLALLAACGAPGASPSVRRVEPAGPDRAAEPAPPARWAFTDRRGVLFDQAGRASPLPRPEPALVDGTRVVLEAGVVVASARHADSFSGFRSLPERLGGGVVLWSRDRVYLAKDFLAPPAPVAAIGGTAAARPWFSSVLLRTREGVVELDPRAPSRGLRRLAVPGLVDAVALDARRAVRLDLVGHASFTLDGGATWTDVLPEARVLVRELVEGPSDEVVLETAGEPFVLGPSGGLARRALASDEATRDARRSGESPIVPGRLGSSRELPGVALEWAVEEGASLPGARVLVATASGARVLAARTRLPVEDVDLPGILPRFARCEAIPTESSPAALACAGDAGAIVADLATSLARPALEATFPPGGGGFVGGPRGRLAVEGRCGSAPPRASDLGPATSSTAEAQASAAPPAGPPLGDRPADDARVCVRASPSEWIERRLEGDDARHLYRWVPGDHGEVTALVLATPGDERSPPAARSATRGPAEGVRVIRVDPRAAELGGGAFPAARAAEGDAPPHVVDVAYWQADDESIRGWILLPAEGEAPTPEGSAGRRPTAVARGGSRLAGVRIDASGRVTTYPLPNGTQEVVTGGPFGLALARGEHEARFFETTDGGVTWAEIVGPPIDPAAASEGDPLHACSPIGCAWGSGLVRLGWGGGRAAPAPEPPPDAPRSDDAKVAPPLVVCHLEAPAARGSGRSPPDAPLVTLLVSGPTVGALRDGAWTGEVLPPFDPLAPPRRVTVRDAALHGSGGAVLPVVAAGPRGRVDALVVVDSRRLRAGSGAAAFLPFTTRGRFAVAADAPGGALAVLDAERGDVWLARADATSIAMRIARPAEASWMRLTLAQRLAPGGGLALAGFATEPFALVAGDLDLARAEVGPLVALGSRTFASGEDAACRDPSHRMALDLPVRLKLLPAGAARAPVTVTADAVIDAGRNGACLESLVAVVDAGRLGPTVLRATFGKGGSASLWARGAMTRGVCALESGAVSR